MRQFSRLSIWAAFLFFLNISIPASALEFACVTTGTDSYPIQTNKNGVESKIKKKGFRARTQAKISKTMNTIINNQREIKRLRQSKRGLKKRQQKRIDRKILTLRNKVILGKRRKTSFSRRLKLLKQCRNGNSSSLFPKVMMVESFVLGAGQTMTADNSLEIRAEQSIDVMGDLGVMSGSGGDLILKSASGDVTIGGSAVVSGGDGSDGSTAKSLSTEYVQTASGTLKAMTVTELSGGAGKAGGNVILSAPNGTVNIGAGVKIHLGNGGDGSDITLDSTKDLPGDSFTFENKGGDSGFLYIDAQNVVGLDVTPTTFDGKPGWYLNNLNKITGGEGGKSGAVDITGPDSATSQASALTRMAPNRYTRISYAVTSKAKEDFKSVQGSFGARAIVSPENGGDARIRGERGTVNSPDGQSVLASGGDGGDCDGVDLIFSRVGYAFCKGGNGGSATARGGDGGKGKNPQGTGGRGGFATARGGRAGKSNKDGAPATTGNSTATGGNGGKGGGVCPVNVVSQGGDGAQGGDATADSNQNGKAAYLQQGIATATGGKGGDGGEGRNLSGYEKIGGTATIVGGLGSTKTDGDKGQPGITCPAGGQVGSKTVDVEFTDPCPNVGFRNFKVSVFISESAKDPEHTIIDVETDEMKIGSICPGATEVVTSMTMPEGNHLRYDLNIHSSGADNASPPDPFRVKIDWNF